MTGKDIDSSYAMDRTFEQEDRDARPVVHREHNPKIRVVPGHSIERHNAFTMRKRKCPYCSATSKLIGAEKEEQSGIEWRIIERGEEP